MSSPGCRRDEHARRKPPCQSRIHAAFRPRGQILAISQYMGAVYSTATDVAATMTKAAVSTLTVVDAGSSRKWSRPFGLIHKSTFSVRDPAESCAFCVKYLHCVEIPVPDPALVRRGVRWVRLPSGESQCIIRRGMSTITLTEHMPPSEFHFIPWGQDKDIGLMGGVDLDGDGIVSGDEMQPITQKFIAGKPSGNANAFSHVDGPIRVRVRVTELIDAADGDMKVWSVFCNTHIGWCVDELTSTVLALQADGVPFFGPTRRADGVFQLCRTSPIEPRRMRHFLCHLPRKVSVRLVVEQMWSCRTSTTWRSTACATTPRRQASRRGLGPTWRDARAARTACLAMMRVRRMGTSARARLTRTAKPRCGFDLTWVRRESRGSRLVLVCMKEGHGRGEVRNLGQSRKRDGA